MNDSDCIEMAQCERQDKSLNINDTKVTGSASTK